jgi:hypothetical protein
VTVGFSRNPVLTRNAQRSEMGHKSDEGAFSIPGIGLSFESRLYDLPDFAS